MTWELPTKLHMESRSWTAAQSLPPQLHMDVRQGEFVAIGQNRGLQTKRCPARVQGGFRV